MAESHSLDAQLRTVIGKKVARLRREGIVPATVYGKGISPISIQIDSRTFAKTFRSAGRTALIELHIPQQPNQSAFVHAIQRHPVSRQIIHVDFRVVNLREEITVDVPVVLVGESPLVTREEAVLNHALNTVQVRALPAQLPQHLNVDISGLDDLTKSVYVSDLPTSDEYAILNDPEELVASLTASRMEQEEEEAVEAEGVGEVEGEAGEEAAETEGETEDEE